MRGVYWTLGLMAALVYGQEVTAPVVVKAITQEAAPVEPKGEVQTAEVAPVVMPRPVSQKLKELGVFTKLLAAIDAAGLEETLNAPTPLTILAPTDKALEKLPEGYWESLLRPENKEVLSVLLKHHIASGRLMLTDMKEGSLVTLGGGVVKVQLAEGKPSFGDGARVLQGDFEAGKSVIHGVDSLIIP